MVAMSVGNNIANDHPMRTLTETPRAAYSNTPHQTIEQLCNTAKNRVETGEPAWFVIQDIVNGYSLGWQSANHRLIEQAARSGAVNQ